MTTTFTPTIATPASEPGALAGFECRCERCGMKLSSSMQVCLDGDKIAHANYHARKDARA